MLRITLFEFVFRGIPELVLFILAAYIFSRTKIHKRRFYNSNFSIQCRCIFNKKPSYWLRGTYYFKYNFSKCSSNKGLQN